MAFNAGAAIGHVLLDTNDWQKGSNTVSSIAGGLKKSFGTLGTAATAVGAAIAGAFVASIAKADEFQKAFSNITTIIDTTQVSTQALAKEIINLDANLGSTVELTNATYQAFSSGATDAADAINITTQAAKFGKAALTETSTAVDILTTATNAYGKENVSAQKASDIFFGTVQKGKLTGDQLASTIGKSIPLFASTGISLEELGAGMAAMTLQGVNAAESTTQLNAIVKTFLKPTDELNQLIKNLGYESGAAFIKAEGLGKALDLLETAAKGDAGALAQLLPDVEALRGTMTLTGKGGEDFAMILTDLSNASGVTDEAFSKQEKTFDTLRNQSEKLLIVAGNVGKTFVDQLAVGATEAANNMLQFLMSAQGAELVSEIIANVASAFEVLKIAIKPLVDALMPAWEGVVKTMQVQLNKIPGKIDEASTGMNVFSTVVQFTASAMKVLGKVSETIINVIGNLVTAIIESGATIGSFFEFLAGKKSWDEVSSQAQKAGEAFKSFGTGLVSDLDAVFKTVGEEVVTFGDRTKNTAKSMDITWNTTFKRTKTEAINNYGAMLTGQSTMTDAMIENAKKLRDALKGANDDIKKDAETTTDSVFSSWTKAFEKILEKVGAAFEKSGIFSENFTLATIEMFAKIDEQVQKFGSVFSDIFGGLNNVSQQLYDNEMVLNENDYKAKKENIEKNITDEAARTEALEQLEKEYQDKQAALKRDAFVKQKEASIVQSIINGVQAVSKTLSEWGLPWGLIPAGVMGGIAAANTAAIASQPIPAFARGGIGYPGPMLVGEEGPEILNLGSTSRIIPAAETEDILSSGTGQTRNNDFTIRQPFIMQVDAKPIYRGLLQATKNGIAFVSGNAVLST